MPAAVLVEPFAAEQVLQVQVMSAFYQVILEPKFEEVKQVC